MTDETQKLFSAPWEADKFVYYHPSGIGEINIRVKGSKNELVAGYVTTIEAANRLARLPELFDIAEEMAYQKCFACICSEYMKEEKGKMPKIGELIENGCPKNRSYREARVVSCSTMKALELLKKIRDGK